MRALALFCMIAGIVSTRCARADAPESQRAAARELGTVGMEAYFDQDYARAADNLDRAYRLYPTPTLGLWSGRALLQLGQWVRAAERLREVQFASAAMGDNDAQRQAQADAADELAALEPRIPRLIVMVAGASPDQVTIAVDNLPFDHKLIGIAHPIDPGRHRIVGLFQGQRVELETELQPQASEVARVEFQAEARAASMSAGSVLAPAPLKPAVIEPGAAGARQTGPASALRIASIAAFSLGGAGLVTSFVMTLLASSKLDACMDRGGEYYCADRDADAYEAFRSVAMVGFYGGAALAGAGLVLWVLQPSADKAQAISFAAKPLGAEMLVKF